MRFPPSPDTPLLPRPLRLRLGFSLWCRRRCAVDVPLPLPLPLPPPLPPRGVAPACDDRPCPRCVRGEDPAAVPRCERLPLDELRPNPARLPDDDFTWREDVLPSPCDAGLRRDAGPGVDASRDCTAFSCTS